MNRRKFLRMLGVGAVSAPVVAKALPEIIKTPLEATKGAERGFGLAHPKKEGAVLDYSTTKQGPVKRYYFTNYYGQGGKTWASRNIHTDDFFTYLRKGWEEEKDRYPASGTVWVRREIL